MTSSLDVAAYQAVHDVPGGVAVVAALMGMSPNTLQHKVDVRDTRTRLGLEEAAQVCELTGNLRILHAFCQRLKHVAIPIPAAEETGGDVSLRIVKITRELAEYFSTVTAALTDGKVTQNELKAILREEMDLLGAVAEMHKLLEQMAAPPADAVEG